MVYEKLARLITLISKKTESGELAWEATADENIFQVAFPNSILVQIIGRPKTETEYGTYRLRVLNERNVTMEEVKSIDLQENLPNPEELFRELYMAARRQTLDVEHALDTLLEDLQQSAGAVRRTNCENHSFYSAGTVLENAR